MKYQYDKYLFEIHEENGRYWAQGIDLGGCYTQGSTLAELYKNIEEATKLYLEE